MAYLCTFVSLAVGVGTALRLETAQNADTHWNKDRATLISLCFDLFREEFTKQTLTLD